MTMHASTVLHSFQQLSQWVRHDRQTGGQCSAITVIALTFSPQAPISHLQVQAETIRQQPTVAHPWLAHTSLELLPCCEQEIPPPLRHRSLQSCFIEPPLRSCMIGVRDPQLRSSMWVQVATMTKSRTFPPAPPTASVHPPAGVSRLVDVKLMMIAVSPAQTLLLGAMVMGRNAEFRLAHPLGTSVKNTSQPKRTTISFVCQRWTGNRKLIMVTMDRTISNRNPKVSSHGVPMSALQAQVSSFASKPVTVAQRMDGCLQPCALSHGTTRVNLFTVARRGIMQEAGACTTMEQRSHFTCTGSTSGLIASNAIRLTSCDCLR